MLVSGPAVFATKREQQIEPPRGDGRSATLAFCRPILSLFGRRRTQTKLLRRLVKAVVFISQFDLV